MREEHTKVEERIAALLGSLKRVEPPADFDFKVRARIAQGRPTKVASRWLPVSVKLAIPMGLVLAVGGYIGFEALNNGSGMDSPAVTDTASAVPPAASFAPVVETRAGSPEPTTTAAIADYEESQAPETREIRRTVGKPLRRTATSAPLAESRGGSLDSALRETRTLYPVNANSNGDSGGSVPPTASRITVRAVLARIGVQAQLTGGGWKIDSVAAGSPGAQAGLRVGDVIELVNGRAISDNPTFEADFSPKSVRVRRDGSTLVVGLKP